MAQAVVITREEMAQFLSLQGFKLVQVPGTKELVYGKIVGSNLCLRVYTSIEGESSRGVGEDAIRTVLVTKVGDQVKFVGVDKRVHRVENWATNLQSRIDGWREQLGPGCPKCGCVTVRRTSRRGFFFGCVRYPDCNGINPIPTSATTPVKPKRVVSVVLCDEGLDELIANGILDD